MIITNKKFEALAKAHHTTKPCVSIYIPTHRAGKAEEDRLRFKNVLTEALRQLEVESSIESQFDAKEARKFLAPAFDLLANDTFWLHLSDGLAVFIGQDQFEYFVVPERFHPLVYVGDEFYLRHLFPLLQNQDRFFILALSLGEVRFFEGRKHQISPVRINDLVPASMEMALDEEKEKSLQFHSVGASSPVFHGQGVGKDQKRNSIEKYFRQVDEGLMKMLHDENVPMVIAGVDYLIPIYREITRYSHLFDLHLSGNPENDDPVMLHEKASLLLEPYFQAERNQRKEQFFQMASKDKVSTSIPEIVKAAQTGKVETLFVDKDTPLQWGTVNNHSDHPARLLEDRTESSTCLLNFAAMHTWRNGGTVYNVSQQVLPESGSPLNGIFRY
jgi:hypothetical protein